MPGIGDILAGIGRGAGKGLGVALTPVAMAMAARSGRNPFTAMPGYAEPLDPLQQQRLATLQSQDAINNAILGQLGLAGGGVGAQPGLSRAERLLAGVSVQPSGIEAPQPQGVGGMVGGMVNDAMAQPRHQVQAPPAPVGGVVQRRPAMQLQGVTVTGGRPGLTFGVAKPRTVKETDINPLTQKRYVPGDTGPQGEQIIIEQSKAGQQNQNYLSRIRAARAQMKVLAGDLVDPKTGLQVINPDTGRPTTYRDALMGTGTTSNLLALLPGIPEARMKILARGGTFAGIPIPRHVQVAAQSIQSFQGSVSAASRVGGEVGNLNEGEQGRFKDAFIPGPRDSADSAEQKLAYFDASMNGIEEALNAGASAAEIGEMYRQATANAEAMTPGSGRTPAPVAPTAPGPRTLAPSPRSSFRDQFSAAAGGVVARATGGPVAPGQTALVGETGPELLTMPTASYVTPLAEVQQAQANRIGRAQGGGMAMEAAKPRKLGKDAFLNAQMMAQADTPDARRGAAYTGGTPTTTIPPGGLGSGIGLTPEQVQQTQQGGVQIIQKPGGGFAVVPR